MAVQATIQTISKEELMNKLDQKDPVQVVNVLEPEHYHLGFIRGSKKIPLSQLAQRLGELDKSREVVTYCSGAQCNASRKAAELLAAKGFKARAYVGGIAEWKAAGLPLEEGGPGSTPASSCCG